MNILSPDLVELETVYGTQNRIYGDGALRGSQISLVAAKLVDGISFLVVIDTLGAVTVRTDLQGRRNKHGLHTFDVPLTQPMSPVAVTIATSIPFYAGSGPVLAIVFCPKNPRQNSQSKLFLMSMKQFYKDAKSKQIGPLQTMSQTVSAQPGQQGVQSISVNGVPIQAGITTTGMETGQVPPPWFLSLTPVMDVCGGDTISVICEIGGGAFGFGTSAGYVGAFEIITHKKAPLVRSAKICAGLSGFVSQIMPYFPAPSMTESEYSLVPWTSMHLVANTNAPLAYVATPIGAFGEGEQGTIDGVPKTTGFVRIQSLVQAKITSGFKRRVGGIGVFVEDDQVKLSKTLTKKGEGLPLGEKTLDLVSMGSINLTLGYVQVCDEEGRGRPTSLDWLVGTQGEARYKSLAISLKLFSTSKHATRPGGSPLLTEVRLPLPTTISRQYTEQLCCIDTPKFLVADTPLLVEQQDLPFETMPVFLVDPGGVYRIRLRDPRPSLRHAVALALGAPSERTFQNWLSHARLILSTFRLGASGEYISAIETSITNIPPSQMCDPQRVEALLQFADKVPGGLVHILLRLQACELLNSRELVRIRNLINAKEPPMAIASEALRSQDQSVSCLASIICPDVLTALPSDGEDVKHLRTVANERQVTLEHDVADGDFVKVAKTCLKEKQPSLACSYLALDGGVHEEALQLFFSPLAIGLLSPKDRVDAVRLLLENFKGNKSFLDAAIEASYSIIKPTLRELLVGGEKDLSILEKSGISMSVLQRLAVEYIAESEHKGSTMLRM